MDNNSSNSNDNNSTSLSNQQEHYPIIPSFGRRRSHGLSATQEKILRDFYAIYGISLPNSVQDPSNFFQNRILKRSDFTLSKNRSENRMFSKIFVEIGFGAGEHLIQNAIQNPDICFIGCEPFENGVAKVLQAIRDNNLNNIRIFNGDARYLLNFCENSSIDRFYVLFPDPWTKKRHHKRRLLSKEFITTLLYSKLRIHGDIIIATDCENYMEDIIEQIKDFSEISLSSTELSQLKQRPSNFIPTRYEQKAISQGKQPFYLQIEKIGAWYEQMTSEELWHLFPISLSKHKKDWRDDYIKEENSLKKILAGKRIVRINHIGSTAISNILAKPIIDILVEIDPQEDMNAVSEILKKNGYLCMNEEENRKSFNKGYTENGFADKVFHLHLRYLGDNDELYFKDYLNEHFEVAKLYEKLKTDLCNKFKNNRDEYTKAKYAFIKQYTNIAKSDYKNKY
ncbi:MAG: tRNA (guanosine(46)-N7)-methyltransferase TrmB [Alphaproteobacteria bacterium]|nr:tRNA (guanosine(46)-N7)-methyltransferase TrmB [Alphaproteobacteria bacterium]